MSLQLTGFHHLTAITADAPGNRAFYTGTLGLRLVKKTVNQDDTSAYHLFYADGKASPGTDITFFDWPAPRERRGTRSIARTGFRVSGEGTLGYWRERLTAAGAEVGDVTNDVSGEVGDVTSDVSGEVGDVVGDVSSDVDDLVGDVSGDVDGLVGGLLD